MKGESLRLHRSKLLKRGTVSVGEESGIPGVAVNGVDIRRKPSCEGGSLDCN